MRSQGKRKKDCGERNTRDFRSVYFNLLSVITRPSRRRQPSLKRGSFIYLFFCRRRSLLFLCFASRTMEDIKPWNHFHMCAVNLWTKMIVIECIGLRRRTDGQTDLMRVARLNVSASINSLLCEIVCRSRELANIVFLVRITNTKPWNHLHMCTVVLWTKIVVEFMFLYSGLQR